LLWYHIVFLALIQGVTEFLPVSSSAHLILPSQVLGWPDQGLAFDVAVHVGTLVAVIGYFWRDIFSILSGWCHSLRTGEKSDNSRLGWWVIIATIPAVLFGLVFNHYIEDNLRTINVIAFTTIVFGLLLWLSDRYFSSSKKLNELRLPSVVVIGIAQAMALIPGTSRSGVTMTAARFMGFTRDAAARFSFLLSIPIILAAGSLKIFELVTVYELVNVDWHSMLWGIVLSGVSAFACIHLFLKWLNKVGFLPFMLYRLVLGGFLIFLVNMG